VDQLSQHLFTTPIRVKNQPNELNMDKLALHGLSLKQQKDLTSMTTCLAKEGEVPARQDLSLFWAKVERAVKSLDNGIDLYEMTNEHLVHIAPLILGDMIWAEFQSEQFVDWADFKESITQKYGMTRDELIDAFYEMAPSKGEMAPDFILRVERLRSRYGEAPRTCFR
jgi:hypothetical protein